MGRPLILVTGAGGFVGRPLCRALLAAGYRVRGTVRVHAPRAPTPEAIQWVAVGDIGPDTAWAEALEGVECLVHLAARTHIMRERAADPLDAFRRVNVQGTRELARAAAAAGIKRFVFVSTIRVNGEATFGKPFSESDPPAPTEPYDLSKHEAEQALHEIAAKTGMETVILRPPLVYGAGVKGNFLRLMQALDHRLPLPIGAIDNRRSLSYVGNLVDALRVCIDHPAAAQQTFVVADDEDVSSPELAKRIAAAIGRKPLLLPVPVALLRLAGRLMHKDDVVTRITASLQVDAHKIRAALGWRPPFTMTEGMEETARWFRGHAKP